MRRTSEEGVDKIVLWEGSRSLPYRDSAGLLTVGVGHLLTRDELSSGKLVIAGRQVTYADGLSQDDIRGLLFQDLMAAERAVNAYVRVFLEAHQFDALVSFVFNVGITAFKNSTLLRRLNDGSYDEVPPQFRRWVYAGGTRLNGLENRRSNEVKVWDGSYA